MRTQGAYLCAAVLVASQQRSPAQDWPNHQWDQWCLGGTNCVDFTLGVPTAADDCPLGATYSWLTSVGCNRLTGAKEVTFNGGLYGATGVPLLPEVDFAMWGGGNSAIFPVPGADGEWWVFTVLTDPMDLSEELVAWRVDANANGGAGAVVGDMLELGMLSGYLMTGWANAQNDTLCLLVSSEADSTLMAYPITASGIGNAYVVLSGVRATWYHAPRKLNRTNDNAVLNASIGGSGFTLYKVDPHTGVFHNGLEIPLGGDDAHDFEFSPHGEYLYVSCRSWSDSTYRIWQYDLSSWQADSIGLSRVNIEADSSLFTSWMQLGPDDRIYTWTGLEDSLSLSVITEPDLPGTACDHRLHTVALSTGASLGDILNLRPNIWWPGDWPTNIAKESAAREEEPRVHPSPAVGPVTISWCGKGRAWKCLGVFTPDGRSVAPSLGHIDQGLVVHREGLPAGLYQLLLQGPDGTRRMVRWMWVD